MDEGQANRFHSVPLLAALWAEQSAEWPQLDVLPRFGSMRASSPDSLQPIEHSPNTGWQAVELR